MIARVAESGFSLSPEIAACSVLTAQCRVRRSNKIGLVVLEGRPSVGGLFHSSISVLAGFDR